MSASSESNMFVYSRHGLPNEEAELKAFSDAVTKAELQIFIEEAMYDSNANCCTFKFRNGLTEFDDAALTLRDLATLTISQFEWFGSIHHGNSLSDEVQNPWFKDKAHQVFPASITAFGIHLDSRYGKANELSEMLNFAQRLALSGLEGVLERVEYDSKAATCSFDFNSGFSKDDSRAAQVLEIALKTVSNFDWFGEDMFGFALLDQQ